jgi:predicted nucleic acid-binding Zn ribbon protein
MSDDAERARRRRPDRIGDLLPEAAKALGLEEQLRLARAGSTWDRLIAERVPPAAGATRLVRLEPGRVIVEVDEPIVASELRMRALELLGAFAAAPGGSPATELRLVTRRDGRTS